MNPDNALSKHYKMVQNHNNLNEPLSTHLCLLSSTFSHSEPSLIDCSNHPILPHTPTTHRAHRASTMLCRRRSSSLSHHSRRPTTATTSEEGYHSETGSYKGTVRLAKRPRKALRVSPGVFLQPDPTNSSLACFTGHAIHQFDFGIVHALYRVGSG